MRASLLFEGVLEAALAEISAKAIPVFTFAMYHDHESRAVSVCVDTEESSARSVASENRYNMRYFVEAIDGRDLKAASLWQANIGRSLSLGDFALVNVARTPLGTVAANKKFYVSMVRSIMAVEDRIVRLSPAPERLLFASSGLDDEVAYVWSVRSGA